MLPKTKTVFIIHNSLAYKKKLPPLDFGGAACSEAESASDKRYVLAHRVQIFEQSYLSSVIPDVANDGGDEGAISF